jgi:hypothetical protein
VKDIRKWRGKLDATDTPLFDVTQRANNGGRRFIAAGLALLYSLILRFFFSFSFPGSAATPIFIHMYIQQELLLWLLVPSM